MTKLFTILFAILTTGVVSFGQSSSAELIDNYFRSHTDQVNLSECTANSFRISRELADEKTGITHFYINQIVNGLPVINGTAVLVQKGESLFLSGNRLITGTREVTAKNTEDKPHQILREIWEELSGEVYYSSPQATRIETNKFLIVDPHISEKDIPLELAYFYDGTKFRLVYETSIKVPKQNHWWNIYADAITGEILKKIDWTVSCNFEGCSLDKHFNSNDLTEKGMEHRLTMAPAPPPQNDSYRVFELPIESPNHGSRSLVVGPFDPTASPFGWHDVNGLAGADFTVTRGNNVRATEDANDDNIPGYSPNGGGSLIFDFPYNGGDPNTYKDASITNLFYMNNMMHDIWYHYGFTETAGNFQANNYGNGGLDDDYVNADAQDGSGINNANFSSPPDGAQPRMQMFLWNSAANADLLTINSPSAYAGAYTTTISTFAPQPPVIPITENIIIANSGGTEPADACNVIINSFEMNGKIAIVRRGNCTYASKVENCQGAGALAVIIVNNVSGNPVPMTGTSTVVNIPVVMISQLNGSTLISAIENGETLNGSISDITLLDAKDSDLDNVIIAHEYAHGISNRLTGGADDTDCLANEDQMGEGWSDWFGLIMTIEPGDLEDDARGVGTYVTNSTTTGTGIRPAPYSTSFGLNNYTYGATNNGSLSSPHGIGFVWATMLWDMTWAFIDEYSFDPDLINGTGGNNKVMELVMEAMKIQPCSPGMVDGRNAILLADQLMNNGENECLIWRAFATRGLGFNASQGDPDDRFDQIENFDLPLVCGFGLNEKTFGAQVNVYPNPADGKINISFSDNSSIDEIKIIDLNGREIAHVTDLNSSELSFDVSEFEMGIYIVELTSESGIQTTKFIKE